ITQLRSSYSRRQIRILDSKLTTRPSLEGSVYVADLSTLKSIPFSAFGVNPPEPVNTNSLEVRFNGILQELAGTVGLPMFRCEGADAETSTECSALGGTWVTSNTDYSI
ncbi:baseplate wedge subunit and tail pin, partial [Xanthomonas pisi]|uniref:baseplate wedge subunit and tail pin n=1 Tax=Xanthomonas pisi TaxID=56457 RepID=UPI00062D881F